ncbi:MAG: hypothetical protein AB7O43_06335 [Hyphomicrobiaceae bacterium]
MATAAACVLLSGCGLSSFTSGLNSSVFGGSSSSSANTTTNSVNEDQLLAAARGSGAYSGTLGEVSSQCPRVRVESRNNSLTIYESGHSGDGLSVMHRGELTKTARECRIAAGTVYVKYGFSGRVLLGPKGRSGTIVMPISVTLMNDNHQQLRSETINVETAVTIDNPIGYFSRVRTLEFQMPVGTRPGEFQIDIGFEQRGTSPVPGIGPGVLKAPPFTGRG